MVDSIAVFGFANAYPFVRLYVVPAGHGIGGADILPKNSGSGIQISEAKFSLSLKPKSLRGSDKKK